MMGTQWRVCGKRGELPYHASWRCGWWRLATRRNNQTLMLDAEVYHSGETNRALAGGREAGRSRPSRAGSCGASGCQRSSDGRKRGRGALGRAITADFWRVPRLAGLSFGPRPVHDLPAAAARDLSAAGLKALQEKVSAVD